MKLLLVLLFTAEVWAQGNSPLRSFLLPPEEPTVSKVAGEFEIVAKRRDGFEVYVPESKLELFKRLAPTALELPRHKSNSIELTGYRDFAQVEAELKSLAARFPHLAKLESYGTTISGHNLWVLKISDNVEVDEDEPELMVTSATHGDELITVEVEMAIINDLLMNYGKNERITKLVQNRELFFIPVVNPQGFSRRQRYANDVDPNRDYPYPGSREKVSVDCIDALRKWFHRRSIVGSLDLHAYGKLIMYPWAYTKASPPEADLVNFHYLGNVMAAQNRYKVGQISKIIYVAKGSSCDYYYWQKGTLAFGIELATEKAPPLRHVPGIIEESREMIMRFLEYF